ncbi:hypothetical protein PFISCL1PPCAC_11158, partial [Pristionchus fissidentatus]
SNGLDLIARTATYAHYAHDTRRAGMIRLASGILWASVFRQRTECSLKSHTRSTPFPPPDSNTINVRWLSYWSVRAPLAFTTIYTITVALATAPIMCIFRVNSVHF